MKHAPRPVDVAHLDVESLAQAQTAGVDRAKIRIDVRRGNAPEQASHLLARQDGRLDGLVLGARRLQQLPVVLEQVVEEEAEPAVEDALAAAVSILVSANLSTSLP